MSAPHTPGPWTCTPNDLRGGRYYSVQIPGRDRNGEAFESIDIHELDNGEANGRLIAAAPKMYEALETARDMLLERIHGNPARSAAHNARVVIESALAKARGETL